MRITSTRLLAIAAGLAAVTALGLPGAQAAPAPGPAGAAQLARADAAVDAAGVGGTAWYVDRAAGRVVVTADSTVTEAGIAKIRAAAGADAGTLRVQRTSGVFTPCSGPETPSTAAATAARSASTSAAAARTPSSPPATAATP